MAKTMMADVLWDAANKMLPDGIDYDGGHASEYSCDACAHVLKALGKLECYDSLSAFFARLGLANPSSNYGAFDDFEEGEERQGVRYVWLLLAMHVAEDEGIEL